MNFEIIKYECLASTNDEARHSASNNVGKDKTIEGRTIVCNEQSSGRGQQGNKWESEPGKNLTFSIILVPKIPYDKLFMITECMSLAVTGALNNIDVDSSIKWPNDIYAGEKKIAGMLSEHSFTGSNLSFSVMGVGVNVNQKLFLSDALNPTSVVIETGNEYDKFALLDEVLNRFGYYYGLLQNRMYADIKAEYADNLYRKDGLHTYRTPSGDLFRARIKDVLYSGELILEDESGKLRQYAFKEVIFVIGDI